MLQEDNAQNEEKKYGGKVTPLVLVICLVAATGGLIFGYDVGVTGLIHTLSSCCIYHAWTFFFLHDFSWK